MLCLIAVVQRLVLFTLLKEVANNGKSLVPASDSILNLLNRLEQKPSLVYTVCSDIIGFISLDKMLAALTSHAEYYYSTQSQSQDDEEPKISDLRQDLLAKFDFAFQHEYKGRALGAFIQFLDLQWISAWTCLEEKKSQSICGTIAQSSCTGKSRLVERHATEVMILLICIRLFTELLAPSLNFQQADAHGHAVGYPSGVRWD